ncbi:MAG TPA: dTDP-4-dehydrorhamnose 3,5-epimerase [Pyrinomonadaceae bacterium]|nr:dTDP-4-dehydrorhamnose 3,5-epimerase [Pyrinomonadaceae bacterium]
MSLTKTKLQGCFIIEPERFDDERGFFARLWSKSELASAGLDIQFVEANLSLNRKKNTLRGLHYQSKPHEQGKLVRCSRGAIYDVAVDLRPESPTYKQWMGLELSYENGLMLFVPGGCAHGFQTLVDNSEVFYQVTNTYAPASSCGVRWNDPAFNIEWPEAPERIMIARDREYPDFNG